MILERETDVLPRKIILTMRNIFERATRRGKVGAGEEISREVAEEILSEMGGIVRCPYPILSSFAFKTCFAVFASSESGSFFITASKSAFASANRPSF